MFIVRIFKTKAVDQPPRRLKRLPGSAAASFNFAFLGFWRLVHAARDALGVQDSLAQLRTTARRVGDSRRRAAVRAVRSRLRHRGRRRPALSVVGLADVSPLAGVDDLAEAFKNMTI